jgi:hypothetical protein
MVGIILGLFPGVLMAQDKQVKPAVQEADKPVKPAVKEAESGGNKMVIYNGPNRTVRYFTDSTSPGETAALRDLERAENELAYQDRLQALRQQYIDTELSQNARRAVVQDQLYGRATAESYSGTYYNSGWNGDYYGYPGYYGYGGGAYGYAGGPSGLNSSTVQVYRSLGYGVGDEGAIKTALARSIATEATPERTASAARGYASAMARAGEFGKKVKAVSDEKATQTVKTVLTLKSGEKVEGTLVSEDADWITIGTDKEETKVRTNEVTKIAKTKETKDK